VNIYTFRFGYHDYRLGTGNDSGWLLYIGHYDGQPYWTMSEHLIREPHPMDAARLRAEARRGERPTLSYADMTRRRPAGSPGVFAPDRNSVGHRTTLHDGDTDGNTPAYDASTPDLIDSENDAWLYVGHNDQGEPTYRLLGGSRARTDQFRTHRARIDEAAPARTRAEISQIYHSAAPFIAEFYAADREQRPVPATEPLVPEAADWRPETPDLLQSDGDGWLYIGHSPDGVARYSMVHGYQRRNLTAEQCTGHRREQHGGVGGDRVDLSGRRSRDDLSRDFPGTTFTEFRAPDRVALVFPEQPEAKPEDVTSELEAYKAKVRAEARRVARAQGWCRAGLAETFRNLDLGPVDGGHEVTMTVTMRVQRPERPMSTDTARDRAKMAMREVAGVTNVTVVDSRELS
jgi:hypothetical protein